MITGNEMSELLKVLKEKNFFNVKQQVDKQVREYIMLFDNFTKIIKSKLDKHKVILQISNKLGEQKEIPKEALIKKPLLNDFMDTGKELNALYN